MTRHSQVKEMLARRAELSPMQEMQLTDHLRSCSECRHTADAYARQTSLLRALPSVDPPSEIRARVLQSIYQTPPATRRWPTFRPAFLTAPLAAALLLLVAALAYLNRPHSASHTASGVDRRPTVRLIEVPPRKKQAGLKDTAAPHRVSSPAARVARKSRPPRHALPNPTINSPGNQRISPPMPQEPQQPVLSQQLPPTASELPASATAATPPAVAALASQPAAQRTRPQRPTYGPNVPAVGGIPTSASKQQPHPTQQPHATATSAPLPPGIAAPGTPPVFAAPIRPTVTPAPAATPMVPPSTAAPTPVGVSVTGPAPTPAPVRAAPAEPSPASPTPMPTPTP